MEALAGRHVDLRAHEVDAQDFLGDRMLDLQARIHLQKIEIAFRRDDELDRARVAILHAAAPQRRQPRHALRSSSR